MKTMEYLVVLEVSQKQGYIFKTDRLVENIGASIIIRKITEEIPKKYTNENEFVFEGGGKSVYAFDSYDNAAGFVKKMTREVIEYYPGVELFMAIQEYDTEKDSVINAINDLYGKLEEKKASRCHNFKTIGLGITETCVDTALPASQYEYAGKDKIIVSSEASKKIQVGRKEQDDVFKELLPDNNGYRFAHEFEDMGGSKGSKNYIAVIVIDGNKMGKKIEKFRNEFQKSNPDISKTVNQNYKKELKELSEEIDACYKKAVKDAFKKVYDNLSALQEKGILEQRCSEDGAMYLPVRPLILAGDDICIVTDARIGVDVAENILSNIEKNMICGLPMRACAGVAMVRTGYPFFRAHELAEELCHNAKSILPSDDSVDASVIDFHVDQGELAGNLSDIRKELYNNSSLTNKPLFIHSKDITSDNGSKSMEVFRNRFKLFINNGVARGFVKQYRDALYDGEASAKKYLSDKRMTDKINDSYVNGHCVDFDIIEMIDIYNRLEG